MWIIIRSQRSSRFLYSRANLSEHFCLFYLFGHTEWTTSLSRTTPFTRLRPLWTYPLLFTLIVSKATLRFLQSLHFGNVLRINTFGNAISSETALISWSCNMVTAICRGHNLYAYFFQKFTTFSAEQYNNLHNEGSICVYQFLHFQISTKQLMM